MVDGKDNDKFDVRVKVFIKTEINGHPPFFSWETVSGYHEVLFVHEQIAIFKALSED